jgi:4-amino-4-deoxy-L-arabinose transferase-like glycosyltransferase
MWFLLPLLALGALTRSMADSSGWRAAFLRALVIFGAATVVITERLSTINAVSKVPVAVAWTAVLLAAIAIRRKILPAESLWPGWINTLLIAAILGITLLLFVTAIASVPNSTDAMAYHLPRIIYWMQAGNVAFFPTSYLNQIMLQPMAEYAMLHTYLLSGGDEFVNLVQWLGCIGSIIGVSLLAQALGAGPRGQVIAALFCATLPNGILQASGAKNDYLLALWLVSTAWLAMEWVRNNRQRDLLLLSIALGLALFTKGTAYLFAPPILAALLWPLRRRILPSIGILTAGVLLINGPLYWRNLDLSGSPLGFDSAQGDGLFRWRNEHLGWRATASNLLRNTSEQLGARSDAWNQRVYRMVIEAHRALGLNPNDPDTTWHWEEYKAPRNSNHEADANNRWHLLILFASLVLLAVRRHRAAVMLLSCAAAFVLFCAYLKWQPFQARLLLPLFVLGAASVGVGLEMVRYAFVQIALCLFLLSGARLPLLQNWVRPLTGPHSVLLTPHQDQYFADLTAWKSKQSYLDAASFVKRTACKFVGIDNSVNTIEYPLQILLLRSDADYLFVHTGVRNASAKYLHSTEQPCVIVCLDCAGNQEKLQLYGPGAAEQFGQFLVFRK